MSVMTAASGVGGLVRDWRQRRRMSQLDLALEAEVSARHLSFVETGRSKPSRELLLHLAEHLDVPLRERNAWLLAAGYAPLYRQTPLDAAPMEPVRAALEKILAGHEPFPAVIVDGGWNLMSANQPAMGIIGSLVAPELLAPPVNALRISLHPDGLARHTVNFPEYSAHLMTRLRREAALTGDRHLAELQDEFRTYPGVSDGATTAVDVASLVFVPFVLRFDDRELSFFSTLATFGTAHDVTLAELHIESFFPADKSTELALRDRYPSAR